MALPFTSPVLRNTADANRAAIDAVLRCHHEQGLTKRRCIIGDVFVPGLLDT